MRKPLTIALFAFISLTESTHAREVKFVIKAPPSTPFGATLYVTGDHPALCSWRADCLRLSRIGHGIYEGKVDLPDEVQEIEYKVTRGSWETAETDALGKDAGNRRIALSSQARDVRSVLSWKDRAPREPQLQIFHDFHSPELGNRRTIRVLLPASYASRPNARYPVIYMHDGQNLFDARTSGSGVEWNFDEVLRSLASKKHVRETIVVGIDCNESRQSEYDATRDGDLYARFLIETLKPWIDSEFRTLAGREHTFTGGASMGAHIAFSLAWLHPDVFSGAMAISMPAMAHSYSIYDILALPAPKLPTRFYVDYGDYGHDSEYPVPGREFVDSLRKRGLDQSSLMHREFPYADHFEADWARRVDIPLKWLLAPLE